MDIKGQKMNTKKIKSNV